MGWLRSVPDPPGFEACRSAGSGLTASPAPHTVRTRTTFRGSSDTGEGSTTSRAVVEGIEVSTEHWIGGRRVPSSDLVLRRLADRRAADRSRWRAAAPARPTSGRRRPCGGRDVGLDAAEGARRGAAPHRRRGRGAGARARGGRDARQRLAAPLDAELGDAEGRAQLPVLRGSAALPRDRREGLRRVRRACGVGPQRRHGRHHPLERPADARHLAGRAGPRRRQRGRAEAAGMGAAHRLDVRRHRPRGGPARRRVQRAAGHRRGSGRRPHRAPGCRPHRVHRQCADREARRPGGRPEPHAGLPRARWQVAVPGVRRRGPRCGRAPSGEPVRQRRPGLPRRHPAHRRALDVRRVPRAVRRGGGRDRAGRSSRRGHRHRTADHARAFERVDGFVQRAKADGATVVFGGGPNEDLGGLYYRPTLFTDAPEGSEILTQEVFGPVLTLQIVRGRGRGRRAGELDRVRPGGHPLHGRRGQGGARQLRGSWPAPCGSTASSSATSRRRSVVRAVRASAARADPGASTSTRT